jgi:hypothetical protein
MHDTQTENNSTGIARKFHRFLINSKLEEHYQLIR